MPSRISPLSRKVSEFSRFPGGGGSFLQYLTSLQSEPPPPYFPKLKTPIVPRGTHNLFIIECRPEFLRSPERFPNFQGFSGAAALFLNTLLLCNPSRRPPYFPKPKTPIVPRGTHNLFIIECRPEFLRSPERFPNFQGFPGAAALFFNTLLLRNPSRRPHTSRSRKLLLHKSFIYSIKFFGRLLP